MKSPTLVIFLGGGGRSPVEAMVSAARRSAALDSIEAALASGAFERAILATDDACDEALPPGLEVDIDDGPFHFGRRLADVIERYGVASVVYLGGGSIALLDSEGLSQIARSLEGACVLTNNRFSSDLVAVPISSRIFAVIQTVDRDNALARALEEDAALIIEELPRTLETQMDIDSPTDLAVLKLTGLGGPRLRACLASLDLDLDRYRAILPLFIDRQAQIVVAGRVGSHSWQYLERETACRVRLFAEERGLEAEGRAEGGTPRSLLGFFIEAASIEQLFEVLPALGDAAFIDTRVLLAHMRIEASREDRFLSDLGDWSQTSDRFLRDFTRAAVEAQVPVLLGGHSLMSGGLMALNEFAWRQRETGRADPPRRTTTSS